MNEITQFKATALAERIESAKAEIVRLYKANGYDDAAEKLSNEINLLGDDRKIRVVVIGQYTAGKSTIIFISHRITTIQDADLILVMDDGEIIQQGTHDQLIQKEGLYKRIYDLQVQEEML